MGELNIKYIISFFFLFIKIGDWELGIGDGGFGPIPKSQSPIPKITHPILQ